MQEQDLFGPLDLLHEKDMAAVVSCLDALRRHSEGGDSGYTPGPRAAVANGAAAKRAAAANCRDQFYGASAAAPPPVNHSDAVTSSGRALFGVEAELYARRAAKWEALQAAGVEDEATAFVEATAPREAARAYGASLHEWLGDGVVLCAAANALHPGAVRRVNRSANPFKKIENLSGFTRFCREVAGLAAADIFDPLDLFHGRDMTAVVLCLLALKRAAAAAGPDGLYLP